MSQFINNPEHTFGFDTLQLHVGQESADPASDSRAVPILSLIHISEPTRH